mmetsp:Transcript_1683/g.4624  ORF Transcript_1683/g.4624 Transcript_1683/m.4624 type:complete len:138 (-) Transcript_1683:36-449(-)
MLFLTKIIDFMENELKIKISKEKKQKLINHFYEKAKKYIYWSCNIDIRHDSYFFDGIIKRKEYEQIKQLDGDEFTVSIDEIEDIKINEIDFSDDLDIVYFHLNNGGGRYDLMDTIIEMFDDDDSEYKKKYGKIFNLE